MKTWKERIEAAEQRGEFTEDDLAKAHQFATCAVGEKLRLGRMRNYTRLRNRVRNADLVHQGFEFLVAVQRNNFLEAKRIYQEIQKSK